MPNQYPRRPFNRPFDKDNLRYRRNEQIRLSPVRVIGSDGEQVGVIPTERALYMARQEDLDLVEVAPNARPPVCRIVEWSKFKYELSKKSKGQKKKTDDTKEMRFGSLIGKGDLDHKMKRVWEFLADGNSVKLTVRTPRRVDIKMSESLMGKLLELLTSEDEVAIIQPPRREGFLVTALVKASKSIKKSTKSKTNGKTEDKKNSSKKVQADKEGKDNAGEKRVESSPEQKKKDRAN